MSDSNQQLYSFYPAIPIPSSERSAPVNYTPQPTSGDAVLPAGTGKASRHRPLLPVSTTNRTAPIYPIQPVAGPSRLSHEIPPQVPIAVSRRVVRVNPLGPLAAPAQDVPHQDVTHPPIVPSQPLMSQSQSRKGKRKAEEYEAPQQAPISKKRRREANENVPSVKPSHEVVDAVPSFNTDFSLPVPTPLAQNLLQATPHWKRTVAALEKIFPRKKVPPMNALFMVLPGEQPFKGWLADSEQLWPTDNHALQSRFVLLLAHDCLPVRMNGLRDWAALLCFDDHPSAAYEGPCQFAFTPSGDLIRLRHPTLTPGQNAPIMPFPPMFPFFDAPLEVTSKDLRIEVTWQASPLQPSPVRSAPQIYDPANVPSLPAPQPLPGLADAALPELCVYQFRQYEHTDELPADAIELVSPSAAHDSEVSANADFGHYNYDGVCLPQANS